MTSQYCEDLDKSVTSRRRVAQGEELRHTYVVLFLDRRLFGCADEFHSGTRGLRARARRRSWRANFEDGPLAVAAFVSRGRVPAAVVREHDLVPRKSAVTACEFAATVHPAVGHIRFVIGCASRENNFGEESFRRSKFPSQAPKIPRQITRANPRANVTLRTNNDPPPRSNCGLQMKAVDDGVDAPGRGRDRRTLDRERRQR